MLIYGKKDSNTIVNRCNPVKQGKQQNIKYKQPHPGESDSSIVSADPLQDEHIFDSFQPVYVTSV